MAYKMTGVNLDQEQIELVQQFAETTGIGGFSAALRVIITEWANARKENEKKIRAAVRRIARPETA